MVRIAVAVVLAGAVVAFAPPWFDVICLVSLCLLGAVALSPSYTAELPRKNAKTE